MKNKCVKLCLSFRCLKFLYHESQNGKGLRLGFLMPTVKCCRCRKSIRKARRQNKRTMCASNCEATNHFCCGSCEMVQRRELSRTASPDHPVQSNPESNLEFCSNTSITQNDSESDDYLAFILNSFSPELSQTLANEEKAATGRKRGRPPKSPSSLQPATIHKKFMKEVGMISDRVENLNNQSALFGWGYEMCINGHVSTSKNTKISINKIKEIDDEKLNLLVRKLAHIKIRFEFLFSTVVLSVLMGLF